MRFNEERFKVKDINKLTLLRELSIDRLIFYEAKLSNFLSDDFYFLK